MVNERGAEPPKQTLYSTREAARALGVSSTTITRRVLNGQMTPAHGAVGSKAGYIFSAEEIERVRRVDFKSLSARRRRRPGRAASDSSGPGLFPRSEAS